MRELLRGLRVHGLGHLGRREGEGALAYGRHTVGIELTRMLLLLLDEAATPWTTGSGVVVDGGRWEIVAGGADGAEATAGIVTGGGGFGHDG